MNLEAPIAVIGGGITGLSACYELEKLGFVNIVLYEAKQIGGKLQSDQSDGFVVEEGPDSIFLRGPAMADFIDELGLTDQVIEPVAKGFSIWIDGGLRQIPPGITRLGSIDADALAAFPYLSEEGKRQARSEHSVPANVESDESVAGFFRRRFGREYGMKIAEPLFAGTHGGGAEQLSMQALYPTYRQMERQYGSLSAAAKSGISSGIAKFISFKGGCGVLPTRIYERLAKTRTVIRPAPKIISDGESIVLDGERFAGAIVAISSIEASRLFEDSALKELLGRIQSTSSAIVTFKFDFPLELDSLHGAGFLVPESEPLEISGATWSSKKWDHRAPEDQALMRVFVHDPDPSDEAIVARALAGLRKSIGLKAKPAKTKVTRWNNGLPQYKLGHPDLVSEIEQAVRARGRMFVAGQSYRGVGIPDCVRQGREAANALAASWV